MIDDRATVLLRFSRTVPALTDLEKLAEAIERDAATAMGFAGMQVSLLTSEVLERAIAVHFRSEQDLHAWLDRAGGLRESGPVAGMELFVADHPLSPGVLLVRDAPAPGHEAAFIESAEHLAGLESRYPGYEGSSVFPPLGEERLWATVIRFRTGAHLEAWLSSPELRRARPERRSHLATDTVITTSVSTSLGSTVRVAGGHAEVTPAWKTSMMILLVLYPAIMLLNRFLNPVIHLFAPQPWLAVFLSMAISIVLLTWVLLPVAARLLKRWLDPVEGSRPTVNLTGIAVICAGYVASLAVFALVPVLQLG
ncbi:putative oxidoreductase [Microbacterium sp. HM58-2]|nr:putative oxidoreductase [Microbacterium sp. HM58-2]